MVLVTAQTIIDTSNLQTLYISRWFQQFNPVFSFFSQWSSQQAANERKLSVKPAKPRLFLCLTSVEGENEKIGFSNTV